MERRLMILRLVTIRCDMYNLSMKFLEEAAFQGPEFIYFGYGITSLYGLLKIPEDKDEAIKAAADDLKAKPKTFSKIII